MSRARPVLRRLVHVFPAAFLLAGACAVFEPEPFARERRALADARARWEQLGLADYEFVYHAECYCLPELTRETMIRVRAGVVDSVWFATGGSPQLVGEASYPTIDELFDRIESAYADPAAVVRATFDATRGFPRDAWLDRNRAAADDEFGFTVHSLAASAVPASSVAR